MLQFKVDIKPPGHGATTHTGFVEPMTVPHNAPPNSPPSPSKTGSKGCGSQSHSPLARAALAKVRTIPTMPPITAPFVA